MQHDRRKGRIDNADVTPGKANNYCGYVQRDTSQASQKAKKAKKRLKTTAGAQIRNWTKMSEEQKKQYGKSRNCTRAVNQKKEDKDKVYSLHKPFTRCISKGKPQAL